MSRIRTSTRTRPGLRPGGGRGACPTARGGFTLIEVLIGVLVLALGLLGLGAIIPVVVREQRMAGDATASRQVVNEIRTALLNLAEFKPDEPIPTFPSATGRNAWDTLIRTKAWSGPAGDPAELLWAPWVGVGAGGSGDLSSGDMTFKDPIAPPGPELPPVFAPLKVADRLWPSKASQVMSTLPAGSDPYRPQYVWDFVGRRVEFGDQYARMSWVTAADHDKYIGKTDVIQIAVFVRRVDPGIRLPRRAGVTLYDVITGSAQLTASSERRMAVAFDDLNKQLVQNAGPTPPATHGVYAAPMTLDVDPNSPNNADLHDRNKIPILGATGQYKQLFLLAAQSGQKIVDNLGNVYTVKGFDEEDGTSVPADELVVTPPVPSWVQPPNAGAAYPHRLRQIVFTPQIPVAVDVITITRPVVAP